MARCTINVENYIKDEGWDFAIYTKYLSSNDLCLDNLAWRVIATSKATDIGPYLSHTSWTTDFFVSLSYKSEDGIWLSSTSLPASLGKTYLVEKDTSTGALKIVPGPTSKTGNVVKITSNVDQKLNLGFGIDKDLAAVVGTKHASEHAWFNVDHTFFVGLYRCLKQGQNIITSAPSAGKIQKVTFTNQYHIATLAARLVDGNTTLEAPRYS
jgi:hypothetical protein